MQLLIVSVLCFSSVFVWTSSYKIQDMFAQWDKLSKIHKEECIKESGVYKEDVYDIEQVMNFPDYYSFKCYLKCQLYQLQVVDTRGNYNATKIISLASGLDEKIVAKCEREVLFETNMCNNAYHFTRCCAYEAMLRSSGN